MNGTVLIANDRKSGKVRVSPQILAVFPIFACEINGLETRHRRWVHRPVTWQQLEPLHVRFDPGDRTTLAAARIAGIGCYDRRTRKRAAVAPTSASPRPPTFRFL